ncbi:hypothetical protein EON63_11855 [archaeon]|nr:MAG: hypothetical protein EON63_11855 [archaeon]
MLEVNDWVDSIGLLLSKLHRIKSMEYQSLGDLAKLNISTPLDVRKLKEQRKKAAVEEEVDEEDEDDLQEEIPL